MYSQGINPNLDFSQINNVMREVEYCNQLPVHPDIPMPEIWSLLLSRDHTKMPSKKV